MSRFTKARTFSFHIRCKTARHNNFIKAIQREIRLAIHCNAAIIFLELDDCGDTIPGLKSLITNYNKTYFVTKPGNNGSTQVADSIANHNLCSNVRVVGINTSYCVYETVELSW